MFTRKEYKMQEYIDLFMTKLADAEEEDCDPDCTRTIRPVCFKQYRNVCSTLCNFCIHWKECRDETETKILSTK